MGKRTYESDIIAMALLYRKEYVGTDMIAYIKAVNFDRVINGNLDEANAQCGIGIRNEIPSPLYSLMTGENGTLYAVINLGVDLEKMWQWHIYNLPAQVMSASYMDNALKEIGLIEVNGKIMDRDTYYNELKQKYHYTRPFVKEPFDLFKNWENIPEDGFLEKNCLSEVERNILKELRANRKAQTQEPGFSKVKR